MGFLVQVSQFKTVVTCKWTSIINNIFNHLLTCSLSVDSVCDPVLLLSVYMLVLLSLSYVPDSVVNKNIALLLFTSNTRIALVLSKINQDSKSRFCYGLFLIVLFWSDKYRNIHNEIYTCIAPGTVRPQTVER